MEEFDNLPIEEQDRIFGEICEDMVKRYNALLTELNDSLERSTDTERRLGK